MTFDHVVQIEEKVRHKSKVRWDLVSREIRHPVILRLNKFTGIAVFSYPGFGSTEKAAGKEKLDHERMISALLSVLEINFELSFGAQGLRRSVEKLAFTENGRFKLLRADPNTPLGKMILQSKHSRTSIDEMVNKFYFPFLSDSAKEELSRATPNVIQASDVEHYQGHWLKEEIQSRILFWAKGAELYLTWNGTHKHINQIREVSSLMFSMAEAFEHAKPEKVWNHFESLDRSDIFTIRGISINLNIDYETVKSTILTAVNAGLLVPVYRIRTDELIEDYSNDWTTNLVSLAKILINETLKAN
ncbi:MAG: hypothetical protein EOP04_29040, partial [Proteobacteria bacterium]